MILSKELKKDLIIIILILGACATLWSGISYRFYHQYWEESWDSKTYIEMSQGKLLQENTNMKYRILTPLLVKFLPFNVHINFFILNSFFVISTTIVFFYYLKKLGFSRIIAFIGVLLFLLNPSTHYLVWVKADAISIFLQTLFFYLMLINAHFMWLCLVCVIGALNKIQILFCPVFYFLQKKKLVRTGLLIALIIITVYLIKFNLGGTEVGDPIFYANLKDNWFGLRMLLTRPYYLLIVIIIYSSIWIFALKNYKIAPRFVKKAFPLIFLILAQLFIGNSVFRYMLYAYNILIPSALMEIKTLEKNR
ncbi:hypothetical protein JXB41_00280 [Candidatus Woesearchaeota archaeon]|nr:hypothetical protein [Candidatus Woesearchaeota archaeon]